MIKFFSYILVACVLAGVFSCSQEAPEALVSKLRFSGYQWTVKASEAKTDPGMNYWSNRASDVYVDSDGALHLKIVKRFSKWYSTEIISDSSFGYGTYTFYLKGDYTTMDPKVVLGFFTWNDTSFVSQVNSEVDIEFSKFGNASLPSTLQYSVQPVDNGNYTERYNRPTGTFDYSNGSTHSFTWTSNLVTWRSYAGFGTSSTPVYSWSFNTSNPARRKYYSDLIYSRPIVVPQNVPGTGVRINFWTVEDPITKEIGPSDGIEKEVIVTKFEFKPL
ncbi:MAG: hypothetical protein K2Q22_00040 [Cytophagales bacterium]|nr:hypothetical protein [Cytophagales bacterium]